MVWLARKPLFFSKVSRPVVAGKPARCVGKRLQMLSPNRGSGRGKRRSLRPGAQRFASDQRSYSLVAKHHQTTEKATLFIESGDGVNQIAA